MFLISCRTIKIIEKEVYCVPEINPPTFPKLPDYEITEEGIIIKDENYFRELLKFKAEYKDMIERYNEKKEELEK